MSLYDNELYLEDVSYASKLSIPWEKLKNKTLMLSGATGMIGSFLVDVILEKNHSDDLNCTVIALIRNEQKAKARFSKYLDDDKLVFVPYDVNFPLKIDNLKCVDYVLHLAANTHPMLYATDPIGTITTNLIGAQNMLEFSVEHKASRFLLASSNEMYGENRGDVEFFNEDYCGYINCNTLRAGYPESKRCSEALCQAYKHQKGLDVVIARLTRSYGPTMSMSDTKAVNQFIKKGIEGENIVLKSDGTQYFSYTYVADAVCGLLWVLLAGNNGSAYNIAHESGDVQLKDLAINIGLISGTRVVYEIPDVVEAAGYSRVTKARLSGEKLQKLGWKPKYDIKSGVERTILILKSIMKN